MAGGLVAGALGQNAQAGATFAENETQNNWLNHVKPGPMQLSEQERSDAALSACNHGDDKSCDTYKALQATSQQRDAALASACTGGFGTPGCRSQVAAALAAGNDVTPVNGTMYAFDPNGPAIKSLPDSYQVQYAGSFDGFAASNLSDSIQFAPIDLPITAGIKGLGRLLGIGGEAATSVSTDGAKVFNGIEVNPNLPAPVAGWDYSPNMLAGTENQIWSHWTGYQGEINLANTVASVPNETVLRWGDAVGTNGNDIVSVNQATGNVTLWDNKYASSARNLTPSTTFEPGSPALNNALAQATEAIRSSPLPDTVKQQALSNLQGGNFTTNTVGSGAWRNSVQVRFCGGNPC